MHAYLQAAKRRWRKYRYHSFFYGMKYRAQYPQPDVVLLHGILSLLNPVVFAHYQPSFGYGRWNRTHFPNIVRATEELKRYADILTQAEMVNPDWVRKLSTANINMDVWLTRDDDMYVNVEKAVSAFKHHCMRLLDLLKAHEGETVGNYQASRRVLTNVLNDLTKVVDTLVIISHDC